ncbi:SEED MATURATION PROTEIN 1 [Solanum dulcamara]|uniref:SEED MATURATION PROTEIN 1 n=1 Tax=Solanum dulcamara TaxID=45834 RepID=UPI0024858DC7|nr:SEED MATURATION PROTEIN 1 [Solanum dulcamara]
MAKSKDEITSGTAQARLSEDDALRIWYKAGTPLEGGKIADSHPVDLFSSARNIENQHGKIADSRPIELSSSAQKIAAAKQKQPQQEEKPQDSSDLEGKNTCVYDDENMDKNLPPAAATLMFDSKKADNWTTNPP